MPIDPTLIVAGGAALLAILKKGAAPSEVAPIGPPPFRILAPVTTTTRIPTTQPATPSLGDAITATGVRVAKTAIAAAAKKFVPPIATGAAKVVGGKVVGIVGGVSGKAAGLAPAISVAAPLILGGAVLAGGVMAGISLEKKKARRRETYRILRTQWGNQFSGYTAEDAREVMLQALEGRGPIAMGGGAAQEAFWGWWVSGVKFTDPEVTRLWGLLRGKQEAERAEANRIAAATETRQQMIQRIGGLR